MEGAGTDEICIYGKSRLFGAEHAIMSDRIEAGTFMLAAAITRSSISLSPVDPGCLSSLIDRLSGAGCQITHEHDTLEVYSNVYISISTPYKQGDESLSFMFFSIYADFCHSSEAWRRFTRF